MYFSSDKIEICIYNINASNSFGKWHYGKIKIAEVADPNDVCSGEKKDNSSLMISFSKAPNLKGSIFGRTTHPPKLPVYKLLVLQ